MKMSNIFFCTEKKCWICDSKNTYIEAELKGSGDDGKIIAETTDGKVKQSLFYLRND